MFRINRSNRDHGSRSARRTTLYAAFAVVVGAVTTAVSASPAFAATSGTEMCVNQDPVVGVWVNVAGGTSGWATRTGSGYSQTWSYNTQGKSYSLTVGCGGTPASWNASTSTPSYSSSWSNVVCFPGWAYGLGGIYAHDRCYAG
jgi:hypothetical protein